MLPAARHYPCLYYGPGPYDHLNEPGAKLLARLLRASRTVRSAGARAGTPWDHLGKVIDGLRARVSWAKLPLVLDSGDCAGTQ